MEAICQLGDKRVPALAAVLDAFSSLVLHVWLATIGPGNAPRRDTRGLTNALQRLQPGTRERMTTSVHTVY